MNDKVTGGSTVGLSALLAGIPLDARMEPTGPEIEHAIYRQNLGAEIVHLRRALTQIAERYDAAPFGLPILGDDAATEFLTWLATHVAATLLPRTTDMRPNAQVQWRTPAMKAPTDDEVEDVARAMWNSQPDAENLLWDELDPRENERLKTEFLVMAALGISEFLTLRSNAKGEPGLCPTEKPE